MKQYWETLQDCLEEALAQDYHNDMQTHLQIYENDYGSVTFVRKCESLSHPEILTVIFKGNFHEDMPILNEVKTRIYQKLFYGDIEIGHTNEGHGNISIVVPVW